MSGSETEGERERRGGEVDREKGDLPRGEFFLR